MVQVYLFVGPYFLQYATVQGHWWPFIDQIHPVVLIASFQNCLGNLACICSWRVSELSCSCTSLLHSDEDFSGPSSLYGFSDPRRTLRIFITIFTLIIGLQVLKLPTWFILNLSQSFFKYIEHIRLVLQEINSDLSTRIINKGHKIQWASEGQTWRLIPYVGMN